MTNLELPVLYILLRNDIDSMNPGKLAAQASHASNAFVYNVNKWRDWPHSMASGEAEKTTPTGPNISGFLEWQKTTPQGFGTVLTLEGKMSDICDTVNIFSSLGYFAEIIHDPTYPILDGSVVHHIPLDTCAYVFVPNKNTDTCARTLLKNYQLYR
jgi:peptidyl-tRNA hydrolase